MIDHEVIIFLDIDDVLNTKELRKNFDGLVVDHANVEALNYIFDHLDRAYYILSTSWVRTTEIEDINDLLVEGGFRYIDRCRGKTYQNDHSNKIHEIVWYLDDIDEPVFFVVFRNQSSIDHIINNRSEHAGTTVMLTDKGLTIQDAEYLVNYLNSL